jgi:hypothetical protein
MFVIFFFLLLTSSGKYDLFPNMLMVKKIWFLKIPNMQLPVYSKAYLAVNARRCELACLVELKVILVIKR